MTVTQFQNNTISAESNFWHGIQQFLKIARRTSGLNQRIVLRLMRQVLRQVLRLPPSLLSAASLERQVSSLQHRWKALHQCQPEQQRRLPHPTSSPPSRSRHLRMPPVQPLPPTLSDIQFQPGISRRLQSTRPGPQRLHRLDNQVTATSGILSEADRHVEASSTSTALS